MSTTLANCRKELSKQVGDYWDSASTSAGTTSGTTIVDTELKAKSNDWIDAEGEMYDLITEAGHARIDEERKISSLSNTLGTLTILAHGGQIPTSCDYEVHRLFTASEKRRALIYSARGAFPWIHEKIWDESMVSGNWLKDGSFEIWTSSSALTHWSKNGACTLAQTTTSPYYKHGATSCKISGTADYIYQDIAKWDDLKHLAGKTVTFTAQVHADTASDCRLGILYDGTNVSYSSYQSDAGAWTEHDDPLSVEYTIDDHPTDIEFRIYHDAAAGTIYVDDARVICGSDKPRLYIADLGLAQETPIQVFIEPSDYSKEAIWTLIHNTVVDTENGYLYLPTGVSNDYRLRIIGMGYLDFLVSGVSSTAWASTINIDAPQTDILMAQAALYLYTWMAMPDFSSGDRTQYQQMMGYWEQELRKRIGKHGMPIPSSPVKWR